MRNFILEKESSYELLDSGNGMKLERFGKFVLSRPDPEALWKKNLPESFWNKADAAYTRKGASGVWKKINEFPKSWNIEYGGLKLELRPTSFKHVGLFPEQKIHWSWLQEIIKKEKNRKLKVLNLFAYTGGVTLVCAKAGADVTHIDASEVSVSWAKKNAELSSLSDVPIRFITEDAIKFLKREIKRQNFYDIVLMDPPSFGHTPSGGVWKIENDFYELINLVESVLSENPVAIVVNGYTAGYSPVTLENNLLNIIKKFGGVVESGELLIPENGGRFLPSGVFARWKK